jgi:hypothetical protein
MTITIQELKTICENEFDWNMIFGAVNDAYSDDGFKSNADNFIRAKVLELSVVCFSELIHIDQDGVDFLLMVDGEEVLIECKFLKGFFKKDGTCKEVKMKNYRGDVSEEAFNRVKAENKFHYVMIVDRNCYKVALASKDTAQKYYVSKGDGVMSQMPYNELTILDLDVDNFTFPCSDVKLSELIYQTIITWIKNRR